MNKQERRKYYAEMHAYRKTLPDNLTPVALTDLKHIAGAPIAAWRSKKYLVQLYEDRLSLFNKTINRLSIQSSVVKPDGSWKDGLTWDEIQTIKREVGYGETYAVEVYPRDSDLVNVANIRHIWLFSSPLPIGWFKS